MPVYVTIDDLLSQVSNTAHVRGMKVLMGDGAVGIGHHLSDIAGDVARRHPRGFDVIVIGPSNQSAWGAVSSFQTKGIIAVLIGLLLPDLKSVLEAAHKSGTVGASTLAALAALKLARKPGAKLLVLAEDGKLLPIA